MKEKESCYIKIFVELKDRWEPIPELKEIFKNGANFGFKYLSLEDKMLTVPELTLLFDDALCWGISLKIKIIDNNSIFIFGLFRDHSLNSDAQGFILLPADPYKYKNIDNVQEIDVSYYTRCMLKMFNNFVIDTIEVKTFKNPAIYDAFLNTGI